MVPERHADTEQHVEDADDDGDLHLVRVHEDYLVGFSELEKKNILIKTITYRCNLLKIHRYNDRNIDMMMTTLRKFIVI